MMSCSKDCFAQEEDAALDDVPAIPTPLAVVSSRWYLAMLRRILETGSWDELDDVTRLLGISDRLALPHARHEHTEFSSLRIEQQLPDWRRVSLTSDTLRQGVCMRG